MSATTGAMRMRTWRSMSTRLLLSVLALCAVLVFGSGSSASASVSTQFYWPVGGTVPLDPPDARSTTSRDDITWHEQWEGNRAVDVQAANGTSVYAARDGVVDWVWRGCENVAPRSTYCGNTSAATAGTGFGNNVIIRHDRVGQAPMYTLYAHFSKDTIPASLAVGQQLSRQTLLGKIGVSGYTDGGHTHFSIGTCADMMNSCTIWNGPREAFTADRNNLIPGDYGMFSAAGATGGSAVARPGMLIRNPEGTIAFVADNYQKYYVPTMAIVGCLAVPATQVSAKDYDSLPYNVEGDPSGRWATCNSKYLGRLVRHPSGTIAYVGFDGSQYYVPTMAIVGCLGGNVVQLDDATWRTIPTNQYNNQASCATKYVQRLVRHPNGTIGMVASNGYLYPVGSMQIVACLGGTSSVVQLDDAGWKQLPMNSGAKLASCNTRFVNRLIRKSDGSVGYYAGNLRRYVVASDVLSCLGGFESAIYLSDDRFNSLPLATTNSGAAACSTKSTTG
jgi:murein DD-endopeptidase MepM/ murein hydrolase activator NlpD